MDGRIGIAVPSTGFFTRSTQGADIKNRIAFNIASVLSITLIFIGFRIESANFSRDSKRSIEAILRNESVTSNSYALSKSVSDLELLKILSCVKLMEKMETYRIFYDTSSQPSCFSLPILRKIFVTRSEISSISGMIYQIEFQTPFRLTAILLEMFLYLFAILVPLFFIKRWSQQELFYSMLLENQKLENEVKVAKANAISLIASQVSHDIRSPLVALNVAVQMAKGLDEPTRIQIRNATHRIRDIANNLLSDNRAKTFEDSAGGVINELSGPQLSSEPRSIELLSAIIEAVVSEKASLLIDKPGFEVHIEIKPEDQALFAEIQPTEIRRILSNLINNSIEAFDKGGIVKVGLTQNSGMAAISIEDNGKGIPAELLSKVVERGGTFGKVGGNGLGVSHAKATIESWNGKLCIESTVGKGTTIILKVPASDAPQWFAEKIEIPPGATVVITDDDPTIHEIWERRLASRADLSKVHLYAPFELLEWYRANLTLDPVVYLCDYEFAGSKQTGIDLIEMTGIAANAVLVTSHWDEQSSRARCLKSGIRMLPKALAGVVAI